MHNMAKNTNQVTVELPNDILLPIDEIAAHFCETRENVIQRCLRAALSGITSFSEATTSAVQKNNRLDEVMQQSLNQENSAFDSESSSFEVESDRD